MSQAVMKVSVCQFLKRLQEFPEYRAEVRLVWRPVKFAFIFPVGQPARHLPKLAGRFRKIMREATLKQIRQANSNLL